MGDFIGPGIQNSIFAHVVHVLLIGGMAVYGWQTVSALVRKPTRVGRALRKAVNAAWLGVLLLVLIQPNPVPYLRGVGAILLLRVALALWDRYTAPPKQDELLTSGPAGAIGREAELYPAAVRPRRD
jgi:hypothetical protein